MSSSRTEGANGRKPSRYLIFRFSFFCISGFLASPRMLRFPERPRAEFHPALKPAHDVAFRELRSNIRGQLLKVLVVVGLRVVSLQRAANFLVGEFRSQIRTPAWRHGWPLMCRSFPSWMCHTA